MSIPLRVCTSQEMRELDGIAEEKFGIEPQILMENAGRAAVTILFDYFPDAGREKEILVFAGKGNNAGDAFVVARRLICLERKVRIFCLTGPDGYRGACQKNYEILRRMNARIMHLETAQDLEAFFRSSTGPFLAIDGIVGTGLHGPLQGIYSDVVDLLNDHVDEVISLDIPSGVNGDTGEVSGSALHASLTISFGFPKLGHFLPPGAARRGQLVNVDISLPPRFRKEGDKFLLTRSQMARLLKARDRYGHKNSFGHTLLIGGSPGKTGAIAMSAKACHRVGAGLVTAATWPDTMESLLMRLPDETMSLAVQLEGPDYEKYRDKIANFFNAVVAGPGLGMRPEGRAVLEELLSRYEGPVVLDADALNLIAEHKLHELIMSRHGRTVLTPHPGEMARLLGWSKEQVVQDPIGAIREAVARTQSVVLLKGAATLIGSPEEVIYLNHYPNDGMATAGSGDVLAGMIGGLLSQNTPVFEGTQLAVYLHSLAGDLAAQKNGHRSMTAPSIIENIGAAFKELEKPGELLFPEEGKAKLL